jgi:hypothetical protein
MHRLEYLLVVLSRRIEVETSNKELASAALSLASSSHTYEPPNDEESLSSMHKQWSKQYGYLMYESDKPEG